MKTFIGNPPWFAEGYYGVRAGSRWPHLEPAGSCYMPFPFFMAYAAAVLERDGLPVFMVDGIAEGISEDEYFRKMVDYGPDLVVHEVSTASMDVDLAAIARTRELLGPEVRIAICGPDFRIRTEEFLRAHPEIDFVFQGEYEFLLRDLVRTLEAGDDLRGVLGLIHRGADGAVVVNPPRPLIEDLGEVPWPARHFLPMERYNDTPGEIPLPSVQMWASRGCPYKCNFCAWPQLIYGGQSYRTRDPVAVVDEMEYLVRKCNFRSVYFDDDTFNIGKPRILAICAEMKRRGLIIPWAVMARADTADREMLEAMREVGLQAIKYGVESADQAIVNNCGKRLNLEKVRQTVAVTRELGIKYHLTFTFGLDGETWETARKTIDMALELDPDTLQFSIITPFPGSRYYHELDSKGYLTSKDWSRYNGYVSAVIRTDELSSADLEAILREANRAWERHVLKRGWQGRSRVELIRKGLRDPRKAVRKIGALLRP
jgi:radical SAM superfamily enzyme YgiQ (UPF0313 family)